MSLEQVGKQDYVGGTRRDKGRTCKLHFFKSLTFLYWLYNSYPQQRAGINKTQTRNGYKLGIIGLIINTGPEKQLAFSQRLMTQEIYYNGSHGHA